MKTIGIIGGMSWESSALYYRALNEGVKRKLGGLHSAKIAMISLDFDEIAALQAAGDWARSAEILGAAGSRLKVAGADFLLIATNTMHIVATEVEAMAGLPVLHIADATGRRLKEHGISRVGLLGTAFTMEKDFYKGRLSSKHGLDLLVPEADDRADVHRIIYEELCKGSVKEQSRAIYLGVIERLVAAGAKAIILGCTEIGMLIEPQHTSLPLYDTTAIHAEAAVELATS